MDVTDVFSVRLDGCSGTEIPQTDSVNAMKIAVRLAATLLCTLSLLVPAAAQGPQDAQITVAHPGFDALKADLKKILDLTTPAEQTQWENIEGYIDTFVVGTDGGRQVQVQVLTGLNPSGLLIAVPLAESQPLFKEFRENIESLGYEVARDSKDQTLYKLSQDPEFGWLRVVPDIKYAFFILTQNADQLPALREIIMKATLKDVTINGNMIAQLTNPDPSKPAQDVRRKAFDGVRNPAMEKIQKRPEESQTEFELRQLATKLTMDEGERIVAETDLLSLMLKIDASKEGAPTANLLSSYKAIAGSSMADVMAQFNAQPDVFESVAKFPGSALSIRLNHPVDAMRQKNFTEFLDLTQKDMAARLEASKERTAAEKDASNKVIAGVTNVIKASITAGWFNAFVESVPDGKGDFMTMIAYTTPAAKDLNTILPDLAKAGSGTIVEMNKDKAGDVDIHRIQLAEGFIDLFDDVFGAKKDIFVGIGKDQVWMASGADALAQLKTAITKLGAPKATTTPLHVEIKLLPWAKRIDDIKKKAEKPTNADELELWRAAERRRARAIAAFEQGNDNVVLDFKVANGELSGDLMIDTGMLRFVGKMMSAFSKENLE